MSVTAVVGAQWGDEGKGRVVDYLAADADLVIRYGGGNNAGHTVVNPHGHFKLHLIPSGIFSPRTRNLLGNGVVINPPALVDRARRARGGRHRLREPADQRPRAPGHAVSRPARPARGARAGRRQARHDLARDRARVRRQGRAARDPDRRPDGARGSSASGSTAALPRIDRIVAGYPGGDPELDALDRRGHRRRRRSPTPTSPPATGCGRMSSTAWRWSTRLSSAATGSCWRASSARCATSTGAPIPS